jgi:hypothetical protein
MGKKDKKKEEEELPTTFNFGQGAGQKQGGSSMDFFAAKSSIDEDQGISGKDGLKPLPAKPQAQTDAQRQQAIQQQKHVFDAGVGTKTVSANTKSWAQLLSDTTHWTVFPFTIGMEMELIICTADGAYIQGEEIVFRMGEITKEATKIMNQLIGYEINDPTFPPMPQYIRDKLGKVAFNEKDEEKGLTMNIMYRLSDSKNYVTTQSFGRDGNVTAITYILELVTPVCCYVEELAYWASTLFNLAKKTLPKDLFIVASAINPASKEYTRGLSQGDHNHIGTFLSEVERAQCYDMIRNFIPHIIGLSTNSPIINNAPTDVIKTKVDEKTGKTRFTCPNCVRSIRLQSNNTMLSNNDPKHYIPYLSNMDEQNKQYFMQTVLKKDWHDSRYQDVFPLTDFGTIEIRVMDAQISICRRIGLAMLNQALCYKARKLMQQKKWVPNVNSETIVFNRKGAVERGLISVFKGVNPNRAEMDKYDPEFAKWYFGPENQPYQFLFQSVQGMFHYLKDVLIELGYLYSPFFKPILQSVFGSISYAETPMSEADYQLSLYDYKMKLGEIPNVLRDLIYFTTEYSKDPLNNPLTGELTLPSSMR